MNESLAPQRPPEEEEEDATGTLIDLGANADDEVRFKCGDSEALLTVELQMDKHGDDVSWTLVLSNYSNETSNPLADGRVREGRVLLGSTPSTRLTCASNRHPVTRSR